MEFRRKYLFIVMIIIITVSIAALIEVNKNKKMLNNAVNDNSQKVYKSNFENLNNNISEEEKKVRIERAESAIKEFEKLPIDTPYKIYDRVYEDTANNYIKYLPNREYERYFQILDTIEEKFLDNPNRQY